MTPPAVSMPRDRGATSEEKQVADCLAGVSGEDSGLNCGSVGDGFVGVDGLVELFAVEEVLEKLLDLGDPGGAANQDQVINARLIHLGVTHGLLYRLQGALEQVGAKLLEPGPGDASVEINSLEQRINLDVGLSGGGKGSFRAFTRRAKTTERSLVSLHVLLVLSLELLDEVIDQPVVKILSSQMGVSGGGLDLEDAFLDGEDGDIEGSTSKIEDEDIALGCALLFVEAIGDGCGCGLVDDTENIQARDDASIFGGLALRVIEVCGDCDYGILDSVSKVSLSCLLHLCQNHGRDLLRGEDLLFVLVVDLQLGLPCHVDDCEGPVLHVALHIGVAEVSTDEPLGVEDGVGGIDGHLVLGGITNQTLGVSEGHITGGGPVTLVVGDNFNLSVLKDADAGVCCSEIDTDSAFLGRHFCLNLSKT